MARRVQLRACTQYFYVNDSGSESIVRGMGATRKAQDISRRDILPGQDHVEAIDSCGEETAIPLRVAVSSAHVNGPVHDYGRCFLATLFGSLKHDSVEGANRTLGGHGHGRT
ncbi:hypothetical protein KDA_44930 [Dictyobacter alpinus]|uniref:Uncharacterized protein n=1 Tax=Dictyobacter alpinus TaxID=2014873 RepID=A0A402BCD7_9CHLR|nr:hypothetical protein [Dictyobacter alpinus]GCE29009.1 hypothetical protein KDA_44930 [Dictyobacter alpinus]